MKESAVQWLVNNIFESEPNLHQKKLIEEAKQIEKEHLKKAYYTKYITKPIGVITPLMPIFHPFENYYKKNFDI